MQKVEGASVTTIDDTMQTEHMLFTYSEQDKQNNMINASNAKLVFSPKFIKCYMVEEKALKLSLAESRVYGYIRFILEDTENSAGFFFTDKQLSFILNLGESTIWNSIKVLSEKGLIEKKQIIKASGGTYRCITGVSSLNDIQVDHTLKSRIPKPLKEGSNKRDLNKINLVEVVVGGPNLDISEKSSEVSNSIVSESFLNCSGNSSGTWLFWNLLASKSIFSEEDLNKEIDIILQLAIEPTNKIELKEDIYALLAIWFGKELTWYTLGNPTNLIKQANKCLKSGYTFENIVKAMWNLQHNNWRRWNNGGIARNIKYLFDHYNTSTDIINVGMNQNRDIQPTKKDLDLLKKIKFLLPKRDEKNEQLSNTSGTGGTNWGREVNKEKESGARSSWNLDHLQSI
jgi:predicted transcriptional regulator